jgi:hypothetical protein
MDGGDGGVEKEPEGLRPFEGTGHRLDEGGSAADASAAAGGAAAAATDSSDIQARRAAMARAAEKRMAKLQKES